MRLLNYIDINVQTGAFFTQFKHCISISFTVYIVHTELIIKFSSRINCVDSPSCACVVPCESMFHYFYIVPNYIARRPTFIYSRLLHNYQGEREHWTQTAKRLTCFFPVNWRETELHIFLIKSAQNYMCVYVLVPLLYFYLLVIYVLPVFVFCISSKSI